MRPDDADPAVHLVIRCRDKEIDTLRAAIHLKGVLELFEDPDGADLDAVLKTDGAFRLAGHIRSGFPKV